MSQTRLSHRINDKAPLSLSYRINSTFFLILENPARNLQEHKHLKKNKRTRSRAQPVAAQTRRSRRRSNAEADAGWRAPPAYPLRAGPRPLPLLADSEAPGSTAPLPSLSRLHSPQSRRPPSIKTSSSTSTSTPIPHPHAWCLR